MPQFDIAAISLLKLVGLLAESGEVEWAWFGNPLDNALHNIPARRVNLGRTLRALLGGDLTNDVYPQVDDDGPLVWEPVALGPVQIGLAWTSAPNDAVRVAVAVRGTPGLGGQTLTLAAIARLVGVTASQGGGTVTSEFGEVKFEGTLPVPGFLKSAELQGGYVPKNDPKLTGSLTATDLTDDARTLSLTSDHLGWDAARLATFLLEAFVAPRAAQEVANKQKGLFYRASHAFPMLGNAGPGTAIEPSPVYQAMGDPGDPTPYLESITDLDDLSGPVTFLWRARALLTGNDDPNFIKSSYHFPLHTAVPQAINGQPPDPNGGVQGQIEDGTSTPGAWLGLLNDRRIVLEVRVGSPTVVVVPLAQVNDQQQLVRAPVTDELRAALQTLGQQATVPIGNGQQVAVTHDQGSWRIALVAETLSTELTPFNGPCSLGLVVGPTGTEVAFTLDTPLTGPLVVGGGPVNQPLPPVADPKAMVARMLDALVGAVPDDAHELVPVAKALVDFIADALAGQTPTAGGVLQAAASVFGGQDGQTFTVADVVDVTVTSPASLKLAARIGPLDFAEQANADEFDPGKRMAVRIGKLHAGVEFNLNPQNGDPPVSALTVGFVDFRVALPEGGAGGLLGSVLPDFKEVPGFTLTVTWTPDGPTFGGGGRIPVQRTLGPLTINTLSVSVDEKRTLVGVDLSFKLSVVTVTAHELGVEFRYDPASVTPFLHGLALSCNTGGIVLAGMFGAVATQTGTDYVGGAVVRVMDLFQLSAIGGYSQLPGDKPSLFLFASLVAPLGGPPWMFITGVAGGFGYNRTLPPAGLLTEHPFLKVMRGDIDLGNSSSSALAAVSGQFAPMEGQHWIAAGLQFTSFGFIAGKAVVVVGLGHEFSLTVLGLAAFGISPIAYFEIGVEATADERQFRLVAGVSPNSYIIHPDIFSLRGQFGLMVRHSGEGAGDFVFSIGGYHPAFRAPEYYPKIELVGVKAVIYGFVRLSVDAFFACTPQALMAGARVSLTAEFEGIGAGLDVYVDVFIKWEPFFMEATMGVCLWFEFFGRHEISVELKIHTPPFGGTATVDLELVSFDVDFGKSLKRPPKPTLAEFATRRLGVPAKQKTGNRAEHQRFNDGATAGLFRLDVVWGRPSDAQVWKSDAQEGLGDRIRVNAEFGFTVRTRLPVAESEFDMDSDPGSSIVGDVDLLLTGLDGMTSTLTVTGAGVNGAKTSRLVDFFPVASFGATPLPAAQADDTSARSAVAGVKADEAVVALTEGIRFDYKAPTFPLTVDALQGGLVEVAQGDERFPLPLGLHVGQAPIFKLPGTIFRFDYDALKVGLKPSIGRVSRTTLALEAASRRINRPLHMAVARADVQRFAAAVKSRGFTVATPPAGSAVAQIPASPARRPELFGVHLRMVAPHAPVPLRRTRLDGVVRARNFRRTPLTPPDGATADQRHTLTVAPREAEQVLLEGGRTRGGRLLAAGEQWLRVICQSAGGGFVSDTYLPPGTRDLALPPRARRVTLVGEGADAPLVSADRSAVPDQNVGVEHDSVLLALGGDAFAGHGCVLEALAPLGLAVRALDHAPGFAVFRRLTRARLYFPAVPKNWSLVLTVVPAVPDAGSALEEVRWIAERAALSSLMTVVGADRTALAMTVAATEPWTLDRRPRHAVAPRRRRPVPRRRARRVQRLPQARPTGTSSTTVPRWQRPQRHDRHPGDRLWQRPRYGCSIGARRSSRRAARSTSRSSRRSSKTRASTSRLVPGGASKVKFVVEGPQLKLTPDDIGGVYPAPGSEDSPDEFLPTSRSAATRCRGSASARS
jgi:hypothetical protein